MVIEVWDKVIPQGEKVSIGPVLNYWLMVIKINTLLLLIPALIMYVKAFKWTLFIEQICKQKTCHNDIKIDMT
jgi:hypothetical protein